MVKVDGNLGSLIQGVSQQPPIQRLDGQCSAQENFFSSPIDGLNKRRPTEFIASLIDNGNEYSFEYYDAGSLGQFIIAYRSGDIKVFDLQGNEFTVTKSSTSYLTGDTMSFIGIDNEIYCVNTAVTTAMTNTVKNYVEDGVLVFLLGGQYGRDYKITLDWTDGGGDNSETIQFSTPDGSVAAHALEISTTNIATELKTALEANSNVNADFDIAIEADVLFIKAKSSAGVTAYSGTVDDGDGGTNMFVVNNRVNDVGDLPRYAVQGYIVRVTESAATNVDDWYLEFVIPEDANGSAPAIGTGFGKEGYWVESVAPNTQFQLDAATMPHLLTKTGTSTFSFGQATWEERATGDDETNPLPSFIGNTISDINDFQGRLVLLSGVNFVMSRTRKYTNFFRQSATALSDDDPIDVSSAVGTFELKKSVKHNRDMILFSDNAQFIVFGRAALTPQNTSLVLTSEFTADLNATPVGAGANIYFTFTYGDYVGVQEYFVEGTSDTNNARTITTNVNQYLKGKSIQLISSTNFNKLCVRTTDNLKEVYLYEYIWQNNQKVQSSWSKMIFNKDLVQAFFRNSILYIITKDGTKFELIDMNLDNAVDTGLPYKVHLDEKIVRTGVNTTFTIPYDVDDIDNYRCIQGAGCPNTGLPVKILSESSGTVTLNSDMNGGTVYFGRAYNCKYVPTNPYVKDADGNKIGNIIHKIKSFILQFVNTGNLTCTVTDTFGYSAEFKFIGRYIGSPNNLVGQPALDAGIFKIPFKKDITKGTLTITSDSHLPLGIINIDWIGDYRTRSKHIRG